MKRLSTLFVCVSLLIANLLAQGPTLTYLNFFPAVGQSFTMYPGDPSAVIPTGGTNMTWNYSTMPITLTPTLQQVVDPTSTPYDLDFPGTNMCLPQGTIYVYYKNNTDSMTQLGYESTDAFLPYTNPGILMKYPFSYGNSFVDPVKIYYAEPGAYLDGQGYSKVEAMGWGSLVLPSKTYASTLLVKTEQYVKDSLVFDFGGGPTTYYVQSRKSFTYNFYDGVVKGPVFEIMMVYDSINGSLVNAQKAVFVHSDAVVGIKENKMNQLAVVAYPNPVVDVLNIQLDNTSGEKSAELSLLDISGKAILQEKIVVTAGAQTIQQNISVLAPGVYLLNLRVGAKSSVVNIVKK